MALQRPTIFSSLSCGIPGMGFWLTISNGNAGRAPAGVDGTAWLSLTRDGETFTSERAIPMGVAGQHTLRLHWRPRQNFRNYLGLRFRGFSAALPGFAACEARLSPLAA